jgi:type IV secretory pathway VirB10-like protein
MEISRGALGIVAAVCVAAGAGGAYLASRTDPEPTAHALTAPADPSPAVEQSEAVVTDPEPTAEAVPPVAPVVTPEPASVERRTPAARQTRAVRPSRPVEAPRQAEAIDETQPSDAYVATPPALAPAPVAEVEPAKPIDPPAPQFEDLIVTADSVIGLEVETPVSSERAQVEDEVVARVTRDVKVGDRVAIPSGARAYGEVTLVERGGKMRDRARLGIRFTSIVLADGSRVPIDTETIMREGEAPGGKSAAKIGGGAIGGAIIGGILGGGKGAIIGGTAGAGAGTAAVLAGGRSAATLPAGAPITVRLLKPATVTVERDDRQ